ncbi:TonB family protein [Sphingomonas sp. C3-2]|uniref:energy transducer TonB n=1 Tax=Sphingomonas sp. C3-2 TaxID=3062169 RepID=UPI00294B670A|nr:TonB family protein [Sphingomonas sp. C3-2]WOK35365.1 TonB family protein [Sphingomonas sp. C3-2]
MPYEAVGFAGERRAHPTAFFAALAVNGAVIGALLTANPGLVEKLPTFLRTHNIPITPEATPEPPPPPTSDEKVTAAAIDRVTPSTPPILPPTGGFTVDRVEPTILPPLPPLPGGALGGGQGAVDPPKPVLVDATADPRHAAALQPPYPPSMQRIGMEGSVTVRVLIGADGRVKAVEQVSASDAAFFRATESQALRKWRFRPATRDGVAVESWKVMTVRFRIAE